jgi:hypothetical protein
VRGRAEWRALDDRCGKRRERASLSDRQREEKMHGAAAACVARGADVVAGQQHRREVVAAAKQLSRVRNASVRAPFKRRQRLTSGPRHFLFIKIFKYPHFDI